MLKVIHSGLELIPSKIKDTAFVRMFGLFKIPLIWFIRPTVEELGEEKTIIRVPFSRRNKNHLRSMYFGVMCAAADLSGGLAAMKHIQASKKKVSLSFKDFHAEFFKRAEGDTLFTNTQGREIEEFVAKVIESKERENMEVRIVATTPSKFGDEPVAEFKLTLSLKLKE